MIVLPGQPVSDNLDSINQRDGVYTRSDKLISSTVGRLEKTDDVSRQFEEDADSNPVKGREGEEHT